MDIQEQCRDCNQVFTITGGEQEFFRTKQLSLPRRCEGCRHRRKMERQNEARLQQQQEAGY